MASSDVLVNDLNDIKDALAHLHTAIHLRLSSQQSGPVIDAYVRLLHLYRAKLFLLVCVNREILDTAITVSRQTVADEESKLRYIRDAAEQHGWLDLLSEKAEETQAHVLRLLDQQEILAEVLAWAGERDAGVLIAPQAVVSSQKPLWDTGYL